MVGGRWVGKVGLAEGVGPELSSDAEPTNSASACCAAAICRSVSWTGARPAKASTAKNTSSNRRIRSISTTPDGALRPSSKFFMVSSLRRVSRASSFGLPLTRRSAGTSASISSIGTVTCGSVAASSAAGGAANGAGMLMCKPRYWRPILGPHCGANFWPAAAVQFLPLFFGQTLVGALVHCQRRRQSNHEPKHKRHNDARPSHGH